MQTLKVKLYQEVAVYRNPITMEVIESFPLPPPSTVLGLVQSLLAEREPIPHLNVSIQGNYGALYRDYQHYIKGSQTDRRYPIVVHNLHDVHLVLHFSSDDETIARMLRVFCDPPYYPYLGRAEDLLLIEEVRLCEVQEQNKEYGLLPDKNAYILACVCKDLNMAGVPYRLPTICKFTPVVIDGAERFIRTFDWVDYHFIEGESDFSAEQPVEILIDDEEDFVWWSMPNHDLEKH
jgi:CRISPR-associated protein Cas5t